MASSHARRGCDRSPDRSNIRAGKDTRDRREVPRDRRMIGRVVPDQQAVYHPDPRARPEVVRKIVELGTPSSLRRPQCRQRHHGERHKEKPEIGTLDNPGADEGGLGNIRRPFACL